ncbi:AlbA family DNA-binding domain-containing protein [Streptomyces ochraceiscleroticus]|uniref:Helix-turn-helix domain-containing protein n=1 Tax=Streptomyces ochraceiscleroticus TaxID=47761 RepID=A0ABW1MRQ4_9ACTN|nr:ATP-binding protein [Streptomyces ochraceiscleroticus]
MLFRSRRLEDLFGGRLDDLAYNDLAALVGNPDAAEAEDLDYKQAHYSADDKGREELAKDVAAFANHLGGLIILGMAEVNGIPSKVFDVDLQDKDLRHMHQVIASNTEPKVPWEEYRLTNPTCPGKGIWIIAVPRSPLGPHAVTAPPVKGSKEVLRYPRRARSQTDWLSETFVATAYRDRFAAAAAREERINQVEYDLLSEIRNRNTPHLLVSLMPEIAGCMPINHDSFDRYGNELRTIQPFLGRQDQPFATVRIGARRLIVEEPRQYSTASRAELHRDGAAAWAIPLRTRPITLEDGEIHSAEPDAVVHILMSALHFLGSHARDRAAATGTTYVSVWLLDEPSTHPKVLPMLSLPLPRRTPALPLRIDRYDPRESEPIELSTQACKQATAHGTALLDDLADANVGLVQTAALLADELFQAFGIPEARPITQSGHLRRSEWQSSLLNQITAWATTHGVQFLDG